MGRWVAIANAQAGSSDDDAISAAMEILRTEHEVHLTATRDRDDLEDAIVAAHASDGVVVVLGGDGSLHAVVTVLDSLGLGDEIAVGLVPMGTGNDFARTIGASDDPTEAAAQILAWSPKPVDLIRDGEGRVTVNAAHVGVGAEASVAARPWKKVFGAMGYAIGTVMSGVTTPGFDATIRIDGTLVESQGRVLQVAVGNGRYLGGGAQALPDADPTDGLLDVAVSWAEDRPSRLGYAWLLRRGRHVRRDDVLHQRARTVEVIGDRVRGNVDGEVCDPATRHTWTVDPGAFRMLLPDRVAGT